jgi:signal transduction histidine kinase
MRLMRSANIEPGLLSVLRWYVVIRFSLLVLVAWSIERNPDPGNPRFPGVELVFFGILLVLMLWPRLQRLLGRGFLPVALVLATMGPIIGSAVQIQGRLDAGLSVSAALADYWVPFFLLFVPLLLIAWQYRYRAVILFAVGATFLDLATTVPILKTATGGVAALSGLIVARGLLFAFVGLVVVNLAKAQRQSRRSLAVHSATLEQLATSRERNRLARELHDTLAHSLSGIAVQLEAVRTLWSDDAPRAREMLDRALADARGGLGEARRAIQTLRASPLEDLGLAAALDNLAESVAERHGLAVTTTIENGVDDLGDEIENAAYRIADEALTNVARHAQADRAVVDLRLKSGKVRLTVTDSGCGFDPTAPSPDGHVGINGMKERAELVGGNLDITSSRDGTRVVFEVAPWR